MNKKVFLVCFFLLPLSQASAQQAGVNNIINSLLEKFNKVKTYEARAVIKPEISFLKMLPQKARIYFKQPDKFRIKTEGIAILPKQNMDNVFTILAKRELYTAVFTGNEVVENKTLAIINVIPLTDTTELILAKLWIEAKNNLIEKAQLTTRTNGTIIIDYQHGKYAEYGLPDKMIFTVDVKKFKIPKALSADINSSSVKSSKQENTKPGKIIVSISEYLINVSIDDKLFKQ